MNRLKIYCLTILVHFVFLSGAQDKTDNRMHWKIAAELPASNGQLKAIGVAGPVAGIYDHLLIVAGGANFPDAMPWLGGKKKYYDNVYVFAKKAAGVRLHSKTGKLPHAIAYSASCSAKKGIVYAGGENEDGISNKAFLLQWDAAKASIVTKGLPDLPVALTNSSAVAIGDLVYVAGGETPEAVSADFFCLDLNNLSPGWKKMPPLPKPVSHTVLAAQSNGDHLCLYLLGGRKKNNSGISDLYASAYCFDLEKNQWKEIKSLPYPLCAGTGIAEGTFHILLFGGDRGESLHKSEMLFSAFKMETDPVKKKELNEERAMIQSSHPGFSREILLYNTVRNTWESLDSLPYDAPATTTAVSWGKDIILPSGEIRAGVRSPYLLAAELKQY
jgi:N-acetylneuraminate epimerase